MASLACNSLAAQQLQSAYCRYLHSSYAYAKTILAHMLLQSHPKHKPCIVLDIDGTIMSEDPCTSREVFTCAIEFLHAVHAAHHRQQRLDIILMTARTSSAGVAAMLEKAQLSGKIKAIMFDAHDLGPVESKIAHRALLRSQGYRIVMCVGDNMNDLVPDQESHGRAQTVNILLSNLYRLER